MNIFSISEVKIRLLEQKIKVLGVNQATQAGFSPLQIDFLAFYDVARCADVKVTWICHPVYPYGGPAQSARS